MSEREKGCKERVAAGSPHAELSLADLLVIWFWAVSLALAASAAGFGVLRGEKARD